MLPGCISPGGCAAQRVGIWRRPVWKERNYGRGVVGGACGLKRSQKVGLWAWG